MTNTNEPVVNATEPQPAVDTRDMGKIVLTLWNKEDQPICKRSFVGRWLVGDEEEGIRAGDDREDWDAGAEWSVALTRQGRLVVYCTHCNDRWAPSMEIYEDFDQMKEDEELPKNVIEETAGALDLAYEIELDI